MKMEDKNIVENESVASTFPLDYDCMYEIFQWLEFEYCMNFAEAYGGLKIVADRTFKNKFNRITIDFRMHVDINRILHHVGPFVKSLKLMLVDKYCYTEADLVKIQETCKDLRSLTLNGFKRSDFECNPFCGDKLEELTLNHCSLSKDGDFFKSFTNLKSLNMDACTNISNTAMKKCFQNNQGITSLICFHTQIDLKLLQLLPNLKRLGLYCNNGNSDLSSLSKLNSLRILKIHSNNENVNTVLNELAMKEDLEELELNNVFVDENTFKIIKSFRNLQRLVILTTRKNSKFTSSSELPLLLKTFELSGFHISQLQIVSIIQQRKYLENFHLANCNTYRSFYSMADSFAQKFNLDENRKLNLILTRYDNLSQKTITTGCLRISNYLNNPRRFKIIFPGFCEHHYDVIDMFSNAFRPAKRLRLG